MQPTATNGQADSACAMLDSVREAIERLEGEVKRQQAEIEQLRAERDDYRAVVHDHLKKKYCDPKDWDDFDPKDYPFTIDVLLADLRS